MLCDQILGNLHDGTFAGVPTDWLDLTWHDCHRRVLRKTTRNGTSVRLLVPLGRILNDGDVVHQDLHITLAVRRLPATVLIATPAHASALAELCVELGNLHVPVQVDQDQIITLPDGPVEAVLRRLGIPWRIDKQQFCPLKSSVAQMVEASPRLQIRSFAGGSSMGMP